MSPWSDAVCRDTHPETGLKNLNKTSIDPGEACEMLGENNILGENLLKAHLGQAHALDVVPLMAGVALNHGGVHIIRLLAHAVQRGLILIEYLNTPRLHVQRLGRCRALAVALCSAGGATWRPLGRLLKPLLKFARVPPRLLVLHVQPLLILQGKIRIRIECSVIARLSLYPVNPNDSRQPAGCL